MIESENVRCINSVFSYTYIIAKIVLKCTLIKIICELKTEEDAETAVRSVAAISNSQSNCNYIVENNDSIK